MAKHRDPNVPSIAALRTRAETAAAAGLRTSRLDLRTRLVLGSLLVLCAAASCRSTPPVRVDAPSGRTLLEIRDAVGFGQLLRQRSGLTLRGKRSSFRQDGTVDGEAPVALSFRPSGSFVLTVGGEPAASARGFDGADAWTSNSRGVARVHALGSRARILGDGQLRTFLWLADGSQHFTVSIDEKASDATTVVVALAGALQRGNATVRVDRATHLPREYELDGPGVARTVRFGDYRELDGVVLPHLVEEFVGERRVYRDAFEERSSSTPRSFAAPRSRPNDVQFNPGTPPELEARVDAGGRFYTAASVSAPGAEPQPAWMLIDTGFGSHALDARFAATLEAETMGETTLAGVGGEGVGQRLMVDELRVGPMEQASPTFIVVDTTFLSEQAGFPVAGVLGSPLFERAIVVLEEPSARAWVHDPASFPSRSLAWEAVVMDDTAPCIRGRIVVERRPTPELWLRLDTGSNDALTVARWAVRAHGLEGERSELSMARIAGVFGTVLGWRKSVDAIELGRARVLRPDITLLREEAGGPLDDPWIAGNLGSRALRGHRLVLDLGRSRVSLMPRE